MNGLLLVIVGGGSGLGALLARMALAEGARGLGIIDLNAKAAEAALAPARAAGIPASFAVCDIRTAPQHTRPLPRSPPSWAGSTR